MLKKFTKVINSVNILLKHKGYSAIDKDGNTIHFQRSTRLAYYG
jgi:hypothetical protein